MRINEDYERQLLREISKLLERLAEAWDPSTGDLCQVLNSDLQKAAKFADELRKLDLS